jgi:hypothetical protein
MFHHCENDLVGTMLTYWVTPQNAHVGKNLHLHPCNIVTAVCEKETRPWEGSIISSYGSEFDNLDGHGHGVKLEPICSVVSRDHQTTVGNRTY